jgi:transposase
MEGGTSLEGLTQVLNLSEFEVVDAQETPQACIWTVVPRQTWGSCPCCGVIGGERHECYERRIRDLSIGGRSLELVVRGWQFRCRRCDVFFTPKCQAIAPGTHATERLLAYMAKVVDHSDIAGAAQLFGIPEKTLEDWYYDHLRRHPRRTRAELRPVRHLGIDEISVKKKWRQFCLVIIDHDNQRVLDVLETREKARLIRWLREQRAAGNLLEVEQVTLDMFEHYAQAVKEVFGSGVQVTADRFHVMAQFQQRLDEARREIQRRLPAEAAGDLKGTRWLWLKNEENLTEDEVLLRQRLERKYPELGKLAKQRESLREIFENRHLGGPKAGRKRLERWCAWAEDLGLKALNAFVGTLRRWMEPISHFFLDRSTNARTEGFNRGIRGLLYRACGMRNLSHVRARVLHAFG